MRKTCGEESIYEKRGKNQNIRIKEWIIKTRIYLNNMDYYWQYWFMGDTFGTLERPGSNRSRVLYGTVSNKQQRNYYYWKGKLKQEVT